MANFVNFFLGYSLFSSYNYNLPLRAHIRIGPKQNSRLIFHKGGSVAECMVSVLDSGAEGPEFESQPRRCQVTALGKLFTVVNTNRASVHQAAK